MQKPDQQFVDEYFASFRGLLDLDENLKSSIIRSKGLWLAARDCGGRVMIIGNGGSAAIAAHVAIDASKNARVPAISFGDAATITCLANDYGFDNWLTHAISQQAMPGDCLVAISSSGKSPNILNAVARAKELGMPVMTLSGMAADNPLRALGHVNMWIDSRAYNFIETVHQFWLLTIIDMIIGKTEYPSS